ncbi:MAG: magnesium transporter [Bacteroidetes bacterium SW_7_64_58]|nr:MAG: magnesium transporter [Bacteroidetes bacterium SW_7_64_58]
MAESPSNPPSPSRSSAAPEGPPHSGLLEVDESVVNDIVTLLSEGQRGMVLNLVADLYPADVALLLRRLPDDEAQRLFRWLPPELGSDVVAEMEDAVRAALMEELAPETLTDLIDVLDTDDAADVLADLPEETALQVLPDLGDAEDLTELLEYGEETAGGIMAREYVAIPPDWTLREATEEVRRNAADVEEVYTAYVVDENGTLLGTLSLKQLLLSAGSVKVRDVMDPDFISVAPEVDQEEVGRVVRRYDLVSVPVVDESGRMMGRITVDDVVDVIRDEAEEDIQLMSGLTGQEGTVDTAVEVSRGRLPWLIVGLVGSGLSGTVIGVFEATLEQAVVLATFIPIVTAMGGNAAVQSAAIAVQGLGSGELWLSDAFKRIGKEMVVALLNGVVVAALLCGTVAAFGMGNVTMLVATLGLTMLCVSLVATTNGALIPFLLTWLGIDPASAMGPFVTTLNDILGLAIYFLIATALYL